MRLAGPAVAVAAIVAAPSLTARQAPGLADLLRRAEAYATRYFEEFSNVVADERYVQDVYQNPGLMLRTRPPGAHRELRSELILVAVGPPLGWRPFRDVYEVDAMPVRDREARLIALFSGGATSKDALAEAARIGQESARHNIGRVQRTLNVPGLPILFVQASLRERFRFSLDRADPETGGAWIVKFEERARPTLFRGDQNRDGPSSGRIWIRAESGAVARTEHVMVQASLHTAFVTDFAPSERFGVEIPTKLTEEFTLRDSRLAGTATYSNFRRFEVPVEEAVKQTSPGR